MQEERCTHCQGAWCGNSVWMPNLPSAPASSTLLHRVSPGPGTVSVKCTWTGSICCFEHLKDKDSILVLLVFIGRTAAVLFVMFKCVDHRGLHNQAQE